MKKKYLFFTILTASSMLATNAFAAESLTDASTTVIGGANFKVSTSVTLMVESTSTAYRLSSKHLNGNKTYSATSTEPSVVESDSAEDIGEALAAIVPALP